MSAWPDQPSHFADWLGAQPGAFVPRQDFGRYVSHILADEPGIDISHAAVVALRPHQDGWTIEVAGGRTITAAAVVLALGNEPPQAPAGWEDVPLIANPWSEEARVALAHAASEDWPVLLIGTGLTMADLMLSLEAADYRGRAVAVSRRGLLPHAHAPHDAAPVTFAEVPTGNLLALWGWLRRRSDEVGFRAAVDSLRPHSSALWQALPVGDRRRFLRHARPWWDIHRHRLAPDVAVRSNAMIADGRLEVRAARLTSSSAGELTFRRPDGSTFALRPRLVVNCTGPLGTIAKTRNPLLRQLLADGLVTPDPLAISLATDAADQAAPRLWAIGPMTKGSHWEITAVPDIRIQAERIAVAIAKDLEHAG